MKTINKLLIILIIILIQITASEAAVLKGKIFGVDENKKKIPLVGATLFWAGTQTGTISKNDGIFEIDRNNKATKLIASYIGYGKDTIEIPVTKSYLEIELSSELELEGVTVTGRQGTIVSKAEIAKSEQITMQGLRKAACCNLGESFQTNASVDVEYTDAVSGAKQIQLLGLDGSYTQIMTEKIPNLRGIGATYGLNYIPGPWMESIQISKGAASVTTGYESITGQINVEYKKPKTSEPFFFNFFANQMGRIEGDINTRYEFNDELSTMLLLHGNQMSSQIDYNNDKFLDLPMDEQINLMNRWNYVTDDIHIQAGAKVLYEDRKGGQKDYFQSSNNSSLYGMNVHTERYEGFWKSGIIFDDVDYKSLALILFAADHTQDSYFGKNSYIGKQKSLYANLIYQFAFETGHEEHIESDEEHNLSNDEHNHEAEQEQIHDEHNEEGLELIHNFSLGLSWQFDDYNENFKSNSMNRIDRISGLFTEYTISGFHRLTIVGGARVDFHNLYGTFFTPRVHIKYELNPTTIFRMSGGKGYHIANILAENTGVMASSRELVVEEKLNPEEAWNYGINMSTDFYIGDMIFTLNADYYRTDFTNQVIMDVDRDVHYAYFYNLNGKSYSNSFQVDLIFELFRGLEVTTAYRLNDVNMTFDGKLNEKPLINKHKGFLNLAYTTDNADWTYDFTFDLNGGGRLPNTANNPEEYRLDKTYPAYVLLHAQIEKSFDSFSLYLGGENLTDYKQANPILAYNDPFGQYFDSSMIWAPIVGRVIYAGVRVNLK
ncbi:MAG: carboxypeptidase-like regulatory domain-containing protein [bacterium]